MPKARDQRMERRGIRMYDQHGRAYNAVYDKVGGATTGPIDPAGWTAPLMPMQCYLKNDPASPSRVIIDYDQWLTDIRDRRTEWLNEGRRMAPLVLGHAALKNDDWMNALEMQALLGGHPPDDTLVRAAKAKNRWVLGKSKDVPAWALPYAEKMKPAPPPQEEFPNADGTTDFGDEDEEPEKTDAQLKAEGDAMYERVRQRDLARRAAKKAQAA